MILLKSEVYVAKPVWLCLAGGMVLLWKFKEVCSELAVIWRL